MGREIHSYRTEAPKLLHLDPAFAQAHYTLCEQILVGRLRDAGVLGRRVGRVGLVARYHGNAGLLLRASQTDYLKAESLVERGLMPDFWPYEAFVRTS